ncbi:MAG TPA: hypothetical protein VGF56_13585 [Rhizomicrobium sp.]|jgi:AhpD family alkylhydroperoxidase
MIKPLIHAVLRRFERRYSYDATYLHELACISLAGFRRFVKMQRALNWPDKAPREAWHAAAIAGALTEDCGPCVQIGTDKAIEAGVKPEILAALLSGQPAGADAQLAFDYARALLTASDTLDALREQVEARWGKRTLIALTYAAMAARNFPTLKRALGHAKTCQRVRIGDTSVTVLKAA